MRVTEPLPRLSGELVAAYLDRLGIGGAPPATADSLARLHRAHLERIPFENLDIHLGVPIVLDARRSVEKITERRRGGFCYELNGAFGALLAALGFAVELREARVFGAGGEEGRAFGHLCLVVRADDGPPLLADVGFGRAFDEPLALAAGVVQIDSAGSFLLAATGDGALDLIHDGVPQNRIQPAARALGDFAHGCEFHQTSPDSTFTRGTVCTIRSSAGRTTLSGLQLIETAGETRDERAIGRRELGAVLAGRFGIHLGEHDLDRLVAVGARPAPSSA